MEPPLERKATITPGPISVSKSAKPKAEGSIVSPFAFLLLGFITGIVLFGVLSAQKPSFPYLSIVITLVSALMIIIGIKRFKHNRIKYVSLITFFFPILLIGLVLISSEHEKFNNFQASDKVAKAEALKSQQEKERQLQGYRDHKEDNYQRALALIKERKYKDGREVLIRITTVDENFKDVKALLTDLDDKIVKSENEKRISDANIGLIEAGKLLASNSCSDINYALAKIENALSVLPASKKGKDLLLKANLDKLRCYQGDSQVQMAIQIRGYEPLKLHVWIKNVSGEVRHANPNHFTLVTVDDRSYSISSETYGLSSYFDAVDLQPGTETSGNLIFDTYAKPKKLVYSELIGTTISRDFPFY
jgi:hypothetical protein